MREEVEYFTILRFFIRRNAVAGNLRSVYAPQSTQAVLMDLKTRMQTPQQSPGSNKIECE
jgi:hypothetical protein